MKLALLLIENRKEIQVTSSIEPVVGCNFKPYVANCMATDHLLPDIVRGLFSTFLRLQKTFKIEENLIFVYALHCKEIESADSLHFSTSRVIRYAV